MASLRDTITEAFVAAFDAVDGVTAYRRDVVTSMHFNGILCVVNILGEAKKPGMEVFYDCTLRIGCTIVVNREEADPVLDGSLEMRYLDRAVATIEKLVHSVTLPTDGQTAIVGHDVSPPSEPNQVAAGLELRVQYRHTWDDPDTYAPNYA